MARIWSSGLELNSLTLEGNFDPIGTKSISTSTIRSGTYALRINPTTSTSYINYQFSATNLTAPHYFRFYFYIASTPTAITEISHVRTSISGSKIGLKITTGRVLRLFNIEDNAQIGSDSPALATDTWYRIEYKVDTTTISSTSCEALIDGVSFASGTVNLSAGIGGVTFGQDISNATSDLFYDDIAINDSSGSFQNSWPGEGEIIHLRPNAAGDNAGWNEGTGTSFAEVDEVTPDDATTTIEEDDGPGILSDFNITDTPAALASDDVVNCVQVGVRHGGEAGSAAFALRIKAAASGTVETGPNIANNSTTFRTNGTAVPFNYKLTLYDLPGSVTTPWTKATLDTAQIGVDHTVDDGLDDVVVSTLWLLVDHRPAPALLETLSDNFDDNSLDSAKWFDWGGAQTNETNQQLEITGTTNANYYGLDTANKYSLLGSYGLTKVVTAGNTAITSWEVYPLSIFQNSANQIWWVILNDGGVRVKAFKKVNDSSTELYNVAYDSGVHVWFRIRESGGTTFWDTSADGSSWTNRYSEANPIILNNIYADIFVGTWQNEGSATAAHFDNFNVPGASAAVDKPLLTNFMGKGFFIVPS